MTAASRSLATALWGARFASGLLRRCYTTSRDTTSRKHDRIRQAQVFSTSAGASQARQVADRFHLLQNLRETIETQLSRVDRPTGRALLPESNDEHVASTASGPGGWSDVAEHPLLTRQAHCRSRQAIFDQIHSLREAGNSIATIARETGFGSRTIRKWLKCDAPPERRAWRCHVRAFYLSNELRTQRR